MRLFREEINAHMIELSNLLRLYGVQKSRIFQKPNVRIAKLEAKNKALRAENATLKATVASQANDILSLKLQLEELQTIVLGMKKKPALEEDEELPSLDESPPFARAAGRTIVRSLNNPILRDVYVTRSITARRNTHSSRRRQRPFTPMTSDAIVLPEITEHTAATGYCTACNKRFGAIPLPGASVIFGHRIKRLVAAFSVVHQLPHLQLQLMPSSHETSAI